MAFTVDREALVKELGVIRSAVEKKTTIPALAFARFETEDDRLNIIGTDLDVTIITSVPAHGDNGAICVPAVQLFNLLRLSSDEIVKFTLEKNERMKIQCGKSRHFLETMKADAFPAVDGVKKGEKITLPADTLRAMVKAAGLAVSTDPNEQRVHCLNLQLFADKGILEVNGTTEKHLVHTSVAVPQKVSFDALLPRRAVQALIAFCEGEDVEMEISESHGVFRAAGRTFISRLGIGKFVAWRMMIPDVDGHKARVPVDDLRSALKRSAVTMDGGYIGYRFEFSKTNLTIESRGAQSVEPVAVDCPTLNGSKWEVGVNGSQVLDFLSTVESESVFCEVFPPKITEKPDGTKSEWPRPLRFTPATQGGFNLQYFTQPVRLD